MKQPLYNFSIYQGADESFPFSFYTGEEDAETPVDLTGCTFVMTLRQSHNKPIVDSLTSENKRINVGIINSDGAFESTEVAPNTICIEFPHDVTTNFVFPSAVYDLFKIAEDGTRELLIQGTITVERSVSYG